MSSGKGHCHIFLTFFIRFLAADERRAWDSPMSKVSGINKKVLVSDFRQGTF